MNLRALIGGILQGKVGDESDGKPDLLFFATDAIDEIWIRSTAKEAANRGYTVTVAVVGAVPVVLRDAYLGCNVSIVDLDSFADAAGITARAMVTASAGIDRNILPVEAKCFVHMPHSLVSLHMIYPADAFDGYDVIFAAGPQHVVEFLEICEKRGLRGRECREVGYGKMDYFCSLPPKTSDPASILIAPTWGPDDLLSRMGDELVRELIGSGYKVYVRPHPLTYSEKPELISDLERLSCEMEGCILENPRSENEGLFVANVLVTDYSGIGFEFAAFRARNVVFVDVGRKEVNPEWRSIGVTPVEIGLRDTIGTISAPTVPAVMEAVEDCSRAPDLNSGDLEKFIFAPRHSCATRAVDELVQIIG